MVICLERGADDLYEVGSADVMATPSSLASLKSAMVYRSGGASLPRLFWKRGHYAGIVVVIYIR